jgi:hypothetical protein
MDKNSFIVLGFLLLCIILSLDKKEGFVTINKNLFEAQCGEGHASCSISLTGANGLFCSTNENKDDYNIVSDMNMDENIFSARFDDISLNADHPCSDSAYPDPESTPFIGPCTQYGGAFELSGCLPRCGAPPDTDSPPPELAGYNLDSVANTKIIPGELVDAADIDCNTGYRPAQSVCFNKNTGHINGLRFGPCNADPNSVWYPANGQGIQISCSEPGGHFVPIGCEPDCQSRTQSSEDYLINDADLQQGNIRSLYDQNKELMQITSNRPTAAGVTVEPNIINTSPYSITEERLDPTNFSVTVNAGNAIDSTGHETPFEGADNAIFSRCNPNDVNEERGKKYFVSGLFPSCSPENEECINFSITYTQEEYGSTDDATRPPFNLEELRNKLPTDIFEGVPSQENINKYKDSLYYFRGFKDTDGNYNVEGQIRCDVDQNSRYGCAIVDTNRYCESLQPIGTDPDNADGCNGPNRTKKSAQEISEISNEELQAAIDSDEDGTNIGDTNFQSPCCKWTGLSVPDGLTGEPNMNNFLNNPANQCSITGDGTTTEVNLAGFYDGIGGRNTSARQCGGYRVEYTDAFGEQSTINFIHNYPRAGRNCNQYNSSNRSCWCPQNSDGSFWNTRVWGQEGVSDRNSRSSPSWSEDREGVIICDQQTP